MFLIKSFKPNFSIITVAILLAVFTCSCNQAKPESDLFPIRQNGKNGYINRKGEIVITPQFSFTLLFSEGLAAVCSESNKCGYIDQSGKFVITPQFKMAMRFSEGLAAVQVDDKIGYIDKTGKFIVSPQYSGKPFLYTFSNGLALVKVGEKFGYIDNEGKTIISPQFEEALPFFGELAAVEVNKKYGFIDKSGKFIIKPQFDDAEPFSNGLAAVKVGEKFGYIDNIGRYIINPQFDSAFPFSDEGIAKVSIDKKSGFINKSGSYEINPKFDTEGAGSSAWIFAFIFTADIGRFSFSEGLSPVKSSNGKVGYIDKSGNFTISPQFDQALPFYSGMAFIESAPEKMAWIDKDGKTIWREIDEKSTSSNANSNFSSSSNSTSVNSTSSLKIGYLIKDTNLRSEPSKDSTSLGIHFRSAKVQILDERRYELNDKIVTWYKVIEYGRSSDADITSRKNSESDADEGWVNANLLSSK